MTSSLTEKQSKAIEAILEGDLRDVVSLVAKAGYDSRTYFRYGDFPNIDLTGSNIRGVSFWRSNLDGASLYQDQLALIRATGPRSLKNPQVLSRATATIHPLPADTPEHEADRDHADYTVAAGDEPEDDAVVLFLTELERVVEAYARTPRVDWNTLVSAMTRVADFRDRLRLFQMAWQEIDLLPSATMFASMDQGQEPAIVNAILSTVTPDESDIATATRAILFRKATDIFESVGVLKRFAESWPWHDKREWVNLGWAIRLNDDLAELNRAFVTFGATAKPELFATLAKPGRLKNLMDGEHLLVMMDACGVAPDNAVFTAIANGAIKSAVDGDRLLDLMVARGVKPDTAVFSKLAEICKSVADWDHLLDLMDARGVKPDTAVFSKLAESCKSAADGDRLLELMDARRVKPDPAVFSKLADSCKSADDVDRLLEVMDERRVKPDTAVFSRLAISCKSSADGDRLLALMDARRVKTDTAVFSRLAEICKSVADVDRLLELMDARGVKPDTPVFSRLAEICKSAADGDRLLELMDARGVKPDPAVFSKLAEIYKSADDVDRLLELMDERGVKPDTAVFARLADGCKSAADGDRLLDLMNARGVKPDTAVFSRLADAYQGREGVARYLDLTQQGGFNPRVKELNILVGNLTSLDDALPIAARVTESGHKLDIRQVSRLLRNTETPEEADRVYEALRRWGLKPDEVSFNTLVSKQRSYARAWSVVSRKPKWVKVSAYTLNPILRLATNRNQIAETLNEMRSVGMTPDIFSIRALLLSEGPSDEDRLEGLRRMVGMGLEVASIDPDSLGDKAVPFRALRDRL